MGKILNEIHRVKGFEEGEYNCHVCGREMIFHYNGGELDWRKCCGLTYETKPFRVDMVVYEEVDSLEEKEKDIKSWEDFSKEWESENKSKIKGIEIYNTLKDLYDVRDDILNAISGLEESYGDVKFAVDILQNKRVEIMREIEVVENKKYVSEK